MSRRNLAGLVCAALLMAACSSGSEDVSLTSADSTTSTTKVTKDTEPERPSTTPRRSSTSEPPKTTLSSTTSTVASTTTDAVPTSTSTAAPAVTSTTPSTAATPAEPATDEDPEEPSPQQRNTTPAPTTPPRPAVGGVSALPASGPLIDGNTSPIARPALTVKIDNSSPARSQDGINQADMLIEIQVEGTTRLMAVYQSEDAGVVGPVRSARTSDTKLFGLFGTPLFSSSGGNKGVRNMVTAAGVIDVSQPSAGKAYSRTSKRKAPHNLMTSTSNLWGSGSAGASPQPIFSYTSPDAAPLAGSVPVASVRLGFDNRLTVNFGWDPGTRRWLRYHASTPHTDTSRIQVSPPNLVVLETQYVPSAIDRRSPEAQSVGTGRAHVFTGGQKLSGTWTRASVSAPFTLTSDAGERMSLVPGRVMLELAHPGRCVVNASTANEAPC